MYLDSLFERSSLVDGAPVEPSWLISHHRLEGRPRELDSSGCSLTLMLGIGDNEGMKPVHQFASGLAPIGEGGSAGGATSDVFNLSGIASRAAAVDEP